MLVTPQDMADGTGWDIDVFVLSQMNRQPLGSLARLVLHLDHLALRLGRCLVGLVLRNARSISEIPFSLFLQDVVDDRAGDAKHPGGIRDVSPVRLQVVQDCQSCRFGVHPA